MKAFFPQELKSVRLPNCIKVSNRAVPAENLCRFVPYLFIGNDNVFALHDKVDELSIGIRRCDKKLTYLGTYRPNADFEWWGLSPEHHGIALLLSDVEYDAFNGVGELLLKV